MSAKYRQDILGILRQIYHDALHSGVLDRSQVPVWPQIKMPEKGFDVLTMDEQDQILEKIPDKDKPIYLFMFTYALILLDNSPGWVKNSCPPSMKDRTFSCRSPCRMLP